MTKNLSAAVTGICGLVGVFVLAGIFHEPTLGEPWGWVVALGLSVVVIVIGAVVLGLLVYVPVRVSRGPARSYRVPRDGGIVITAFAYPQTWGKLLALAPAASTTDVAGHFSVVVDGRGLSFRRSSEEPDEIVFVGWSRIESVVPTVIADGSRRHNGISVTVIGSDRNSSLDFTCARVGLLGIYGRQPRHELQDLCRLIGSQRTEVDHAR